MSDENDTEYRIRSRERIAVSAPRPAQRPRDVVHPPTLATGSAPEIPVIPDLAVPALAAVTVPFGRLTVTVEADSDRVVITLPGGVRIVGTPEDAERLAAALRG